jgi:hypothetical protein
MTKKILAEAFQQAYTGINLSSKFHSVPDLEESNEIKPTQRNQNKAGLDSCISRTITSNSTNRTRA